MAKQLLLLSIFVFLLISIAAVQAEDAELASSSAELSTAIQKTAALAGAPFKLQVNCTDEKGIRSFELYPGGVAIWKDHTQIRLTEAQRTSLLQNLLDSKFAELEPIYGGKIKPHEAEAAFRVSCQVSLQIDGLEKSSVQQVDGEQSEQLTGLAAALLDQLEPLAADGVSADDLQDGLAKLAKGTVAPQAFSLRMLYLPAGEEEKAGGEEKAGSILRIAAGAASRQAYNPGRELGAEIWTTLEQCRIAELAGAIHAANLPELPTNLWSQPHIELTVRLLGHEKTVTARPFTRLDSREPGAPQERFNALVEGLQAFDPSSGCLENTGSE